MNSSSPISAPSAAPSQPEGRLAYKWKVLITISFGVFMIILDSTVINVAFRTLQREYGATLTDAQWVLSVYTLALGITTPMSGFLADRFGIKKIYLLGLGVFTLASALCGVAPSLVLLVAARLLQGIGGGMAQPLGPAMLYRAFPPREQGTALGIFGITLVVAPGLGPILGGLLVDANLWRLIFFINVPIGIAAVLLGSRFLREEGQRRKTSLDPLGLVFTTIGFGALLLGATNAESAGWTAPSTLMAFGIGIVGLIIFAFVELRVSKDPLLNLRLFKNKVYLNASLVGYVTVLALFGAEFLMPLYLQVLRGFTALETGLTLLALALASGITTPLAGRVYDKIGPRAIVVTGFALLAVNTWQLTQLQADTPINTILLLLALRGLALGLTVQSTFTTALGSVPLPMLPRGSSLSNSTRFVVTAVAVAALATILSSALSPQVAEMQEKMRQTSAQSTTPNARFGICNTPGVAAEENFPPGMADQLKAAPAAQAAAIKQTTLAGLKTACDDYVRGFERTYLVTFFASLVALALAAFLPGWPGKWAGRGSTQTAVPGH